MGKLSRAWLIFVLVCAQCTLLAIVNPAAASAASCEDEVTNGCRAPATLVPGFRGAGRVSAAGQRGGAWRWAGAWVNDSLRADEQVYVYPFAAGWRWVYSYGRAAWFALPASGVFIEYESLFPEAENWPASEVGSPTGLWDGREPRGAVMLIHGGGYFGNPAAIANMRSVADRWRARGFVTLSVDYRSGVASRFDVARFHDRLREVVGQIPMCATGASAGAGLALMVSADRPDIACVVAEGAPANLHTIPGFVIASSALAGQSAAVLSYMSPASYALQMPPSTLVANAATDIYTPASQVFELCLRNPEIKGMVLGSPEAGQSGAMFVHSAVAESELQRFVAAEDALVGELLRAR